GIAKSARTRRCHRHRRKLSHTALSKASPKALAHGVVIGIAKSARTRRCHRHRRPNPSRVAHLPHDSGGRTRSRCIGRIQLIAATRSLLAYRATPETAPALLRRLKRGVFYPLVDLQAAINRYLAEHNYSSKPCVWTADPERIISAARRGYQMLDSNHRL